MRIFKRLVALFFYLISLRLIRYKKYKISKSQAQANQIPKFIVENSFNFYKKFGLFYEQLNIDKNLIIDGAWKDDLIERRPLQIKYLSEGLKDQYKELISNMFFNELMSGLYSFGYWNEIGVRCKIGFLETIDNILDLYPNDEAIFSNTKIPNWGLEFSDNRIISYCDPSHFLQAKSIKNLLNNCFEVSRKKVLDIGSGFGGMADKLARLSSDEDLDIILFDIPSNLLTAYAFLTLGHGANSVLLADSEVVISEWVNNSKSYSGGVRILLVPTVLIYSLTNCIDSFDVVHNNGSFSEMDLGTINFYIENLVKNKTKFLIETNSIKPVINNSEHVEVISSDFFIPNDLNLVCRYKPADYWASSNRYVTNIYAKRKGIK